MTHVNVHTNLCSLSLIALALILYRHTFCLIAFTFTYNYSVHFCVDNFTLICSYFIDIFFVVPLPNLFLTFSLNISQIKEFWSSYSINSFHLHLIPVHIPFLFFSLRKLLSLCPKNSCVFPLTYIVMLPKFFYLALIHSI